MFSVTIDHNWLYCRPGTISLRPLLLFNHQFFPRAKITSNTKPHQTLEHRRRCHWCLLYYKESRVQWWHIFSSGCLNSADRRQFALTPRKNNQHFSFFYSRISKVSDLAFIMVANKKFKILNIKENWRHLAKNYIYRYRVDQNYVEVFLIQLRMPVIFNGLSTGSGQNAYFLLEMFQNLNFS